MDNQDRAIPTDIPMFTDLLREAGYEVGLFGKAHVRDLDKRNWDYYYGYPGAATDYFWPVITEGSTAGSARPRSTKGTWKTWSWTRRFNG